MGKIFWVNAKPYNKKVVTTALESGADSVIVPRGQSKKVRDLGLIKTVSEDGDLKFGDDVVEVSIASEKDEAKALKVPADKLILVKTKNWKVIPLENLIAKGANVIAQVKNLEEAQTAFGILEKGVRHIEIMDDDFLGNHDRALELLHRWAC